MILDVVEVAILHSGLNLATAFTNILHEFRLSDKVLLLLKFEQKKLTENF